jgi:hypothetical protein
MACYHPITAYRPKLNSGSNQLVFNPTSAEQPDDPLKISCGKCIGCKLQRSLDWAIRCVHEASLHKDNSFITLTFDEKNISSNRSLDKRDFQLFMKRLRKNTGTKIRYYHCGEYGCGYRPGDRFECRTPGCKHTFRPHHHACLFGIDFPDKTHHKTINGHPIYTSKLLSDTWTHGFVTVADVTFESAAYVARYVTKKITGPPAPAHYERAHPLTGEIFDVLPEYNTMSRRPGLGKDWLQKYTSDVYPHDRIIHKGHPLRPPKYYDNIFDVENPEVMDEVKLSRIQKMRTNLKDSTFERLAVKERLQYVKFEKLKRGYEKL